jgi:predicted RNase H-like HicB family nuclease
VQIAASSILSVIHGVQRRWPHCLAPSLTIERMKTARQLTAIIEREGDSYVALCPELDIASQGDTVESARTTLVEALELFFESADPAEVARRLHGEVFVTRVEVMVG